MEFPPLYPVLDDETSRRHGWSVVALARAVLAGGARLIQVRAKTLGSAALLDLSREVVALARPAGARVVINDRADVARLADADGVHVGQDDLPPEDVRLLMGPGRLVGFSTHTRNQVDAAAGRPIGYVAVGPVFATATKRGADVPVGLDLIRYATARHPGRPVVAIGGITLDRARAVRDAGAASLAVIADLLAGGDPERRTRLYLEALGKP